MIIDGRYQVSVLINHGYIFEIRDLLNKNSYDTPKLIFYFHKEDFPIDFRKVFSLKNIIKYYIWKIKQRLFWKYKIKIKIKSLNKNKPYPIDPYA